MKRLLLEPQDVMFFKDGRPMEKGLAGHGAAWPLPHTLNAALHAALHRAGIAGGSHVHRTGAGASDDPHELKRKFGSLQSAGPFPVRLSSAATDWYFPRPADAGKQFSTEVTFAPLLQPGGSSNLGHDFPFLSPVPSLVDPAKVTLDPWWSRKAWSAYLGVDPDPNAPAAPYFLLDKEIFLAEHSIGIGIDPVADTQDGQRIYSAQYLRLHPDWGFGCLAEAPDRTAGDLFEQLIPGSCTILVGGQQRACHARLINNDEALPLPTGKIRDFPEHRIAGRPAWLVKWVLLTPAVWPELDSAAARHPGGWLPSWVDAASGRVLLREITRSERKSLRKSGTTAGACDPSQSPGRLVAAQVPKPIEITGWALANGADRTSGGAKSTHLGVPAGAVYYFACDSSESAEQLARLLNWHGTDSEPRTISHRRSLLCGEKGFGIGVCTGWMPANS